MKLGKLVGFAALLIAIYILWQLRQVLLLVFMAVVFAIAINSVVRRLQQAGIKRSLAAPISVVSLIALLVIFVALVLPPFIDQFQLLAELVPRGLVRLQEWAEVVQRRLPTQLPIPSVSNLMQQVQPFVRWVFTNFFSLFTNFLTIGLNLLLVLVLMTMLLVNPVPYRKGFTLLFPSFYRQRVDTILSLCEVALVNWIHGILIDMVVIGVASAIGLWILRVPLVFANAALAGMLEAIPNVGPTLSLIPPMAIALLDAPWKAIAVLILYLLLQQLEQFLLVPFVMAKQVSLLPAVTLIAQVVFAIFFGFLGLFLAIPLVIVVQIWIREVLVKDILDQWQNGADDPTIQSSNEQTESGNQRAEV